MDVLCIIFLVLLFTFFGIVAGSFIKSARVVGSGLLLIFASFIIFGLLVLMMESVSKLFPETANVYKNLLILFAASAFLTEVLIDKFFSCSRM